MKKLLFKLVLGLIMYQTGTIYAQDDECIPENVPEQFQSSVGFNFQFYNNGEMAKLDGIASRFRQFAAWNNAGGNPAGTPIDPYPFDPIRPNRFAPNYIYTFNNYLESPIMNSLIALRDDPDSPVLMYFPTSTSSVEFLSSDLEWTEDSDDNNNCDGTTDDDPNWISGDIIHARWRKPVPFMESDPFDACSGTDVSNLWSFEDPSSYRFFAEYLSYYTGLFGNGVDPLPLNFNYNDYYFGHTTSITGMGYNNYIEIWNEPDAWWTWPNNYGYFEPDELAAMCHAAIGNSGITTTMGDEKNGIPAQNFTNEFVGILNYDPSMQIISPSPHEMDMTYYTAFMNALREYRPDFNFAVNSFHHYSAYDLNDLDNLNLGLTIGTGITRANIINASLNRGEFVNGIDLRNFHDYSFGGNQIETVQLESSPNLPTSFWICPELDGYKERGTEIRSELEAEGIGGDIWITEWGYPSVINSFAQYPAGLDPNGTQANWLLRGFIEYNATPEISASLWHWIQDENGPEWDKKTGILDAGGGRKTSWYYIHTAMTEIGDRALIASLQLEDCVADYVPSVKLIYDDNDNPVSLRGIDPMNDLTGEDINCPKIYKYSGECCPDGKENYENIVYAIWFPYMINKSEELQFTLGDLQVDGLPHSFYTVEPVNGLVDGYTSPLQGVDYNIETEEYFINLEVTEKPLFLHFVGERICSNPTQDEPIDPNCSYSISTSNFSSTCTEISFDINIDGFPTNECTIDDITNITVTGSTANAHDAFISAVNINPSIDNNVTVTISGLIPDQTYYFTIGAEFNLGAEFGYITETIGGFTTLDGCFDDMNLTNRGLSIDDQCNGTIVTRINTGGEDVAAFQVIGTITQVLSETNPEPLSSSSPIDTSPSIDWSAPNNNGHQRTELLVPALTPGACYVLELFLVDVLGNIYGDPIIETFCIPEDCGSGPGIVNTITSITCEEICFLPIINTMTNDDGTEVTNCVFEYRIDITDQEGNLAQIYQGFNADKCDVSQPFCIDFTTEDAQGQLELLGPPPYVYQIISIFNGQTTNGNRMDIDFCCNSTFVNPELRISNNCYDVYSYVHFCLSDIEACLNTSLDDVNDVNVNVQFETEGVVNKTDIWGDFDSEEGDNCHLIQFKSSVKPVCEDINFTIFVSGTSDNNTTGTSEVINVNFSGTISYEGCCRDDEDDPHTPTPNPAMAASVVSTSEDGSMFIAGKVPDYKDVILESRAQNIPVRYVLSSNRRNQIIDYDDYSDRLNLWLPKGYDTGQELNENYIVHLLVSNTLYQIPFPEIPDPNSIGGDKPLNRMITDSEVGKIEIYPNPSEDYVMINIADDLEIQEMIIFDAKGKEYLSIVVTSNQLEIDVSDLPGGIYFVKVISNTKEDIKPQKLIIHK